jgi:hypothetical protein
LAAERESGSGMPDQVRHGEGRGGGEVKYRLGCVVFTIVGLGWLGFVAFEFFATTLGDCGSDQPCQFYRPFVDGFVFWRGLAVALLLILAFLFFRAFIGTDRDDQ